MELKNGNSQDENWRILIVEDDERLANLTKDYLESNGLKVSIEGDGSRAIERIKTEQPDLVVLDLMLPGEDGLAVCRIVRPHYTGPILMLTARTEDLDQVLGLEMGADDYVTKPFELRELLVRVKNILWRIGLAEKTPVVEEQEDDDLFHFGACSFDIPKRKLLKNNMPVKLTKAEYDILVAFVANPSRVLSRDRLLNLIAHRVDAPNDRTIDVLVRRLRNKIEDNPKEPQIFTTIHGEGYLFAADIS